MTTRIQKSELRPLGDTRGDCARQKAEETLVDPASGEPVVRDLRFHRFVAHQREFYFLNQTDDH